MKKQLFGLIGAAALAFASVPSASALEYENTDYLQHAKSPDGSYDCVVWHEGDAGELFFDGDTVNGGAFSCKWNGIDSCSFTKGLIIDDMECSYKELDGITCDYSIEHSSDGVSWFGLHGWVESLEPVYQANKYAEYMIIDGFIGYVPFADETPVDTVTIDGSRYNIYDVKHAAFDAPVFYQFASVITEEDNKAKVDCTNSVTGRISADEHFAAWEKAGIKDTGTLCEVSFDVEGWQSSGEAKVIQNDITIGGKSQPVPEMADANGDGDFNIADVVIVQKWLISAPDTELSDWKAGDRNGNNRLDVFDLVLMKRELFAAPRKQSLC
jgi:hypothetical protein